ncbi:hypothetical protein RD792_014270 [Penstemon davidsonii]|uniref:TF-B3 domain-containing protein n=1 Tax=Penstemon davidsonii TaxID=160366 RepID=A0ABR0CNX3_9LAMI|nr:hypothetical protein RD792_014270 [Penstemon davidsonii]
MSINHHYSSDISQSYYMSQYMMQEPSPETREMEKELETDEIPKMPLFEKSLTPSDVGKLNRLVIPKQHAEKYFPINGGVSNEKGLLLGFEDEVAKSWRFRYSYWNSSQSYVLTKGWSRFVKEKKLDAGDFVLFFRHRLDAGRLFIGWRRRDSAVAQPGGGRWGREVHCSYPSQNIQLGSSTSFPYRTTSTHDCPHPGSNQNPIAAAANGNPKRLRLFGVNMECQPDESEPSTPEGSPMSSQGQAHHHSYHNHMKIGDDRGFPDKGGMRMVAIKNLSSFNIVQKRVLLL